MPMNLFGNRRQHLIYDRLLSPAILTQQLLLNNEFAGKMLHDGPVPEKKKYPIMEQRNDAICQQ